MILVSVREARVLMVQEKAGQPAAAARSLQLANHFLQHVAHAADHGHIDLHPL